MEAFFLYLIKATALLSLFLVFYRLFLYKETHFQVSRWFLLTAIPASFVLPLITWTTYKEVLVELQPVYTQSSAVIQTVAETPEESVNIFMTWQGLALLLYLGTALFLLGRLLIRSWQLTSMLQRHPQEKTRRVSLRQIAQKVSSFFLLPLHCVQPGSLSSERN